MTIYYLTLHSFANRVGIVSTIRTYRDDGRLPKPDAVLGEGMLQSMVGCLKPSMNGKSRHLDAGTFSLSSS